jgi:hypothetical protein
MSYTFSACKPNLAETSMMTAEEKANKREYDGYSK